MNPERYTNPEQFYPERFENHTLSMVEYQRHPDPLVRDHFAFGAGRRHVSHTSVNIRTPNLMLSSQCPGIQITDQALFIAISRILWAFELSAPPGHVVDTAQETAFTGFQGRRPKPFPLVVTPRSNTRVETIERELKAAEVNIFSQYG